MSTCNSTLQLRDHLPLKQGLRLGYSSDSSLLKGLRDHLPLKQGLRPTCIAYYSSVRSELRDHLPLKQGLRHFNPEVFDLNGVPPRPSSTKTRIEIHPLEMRGGFFDDK